LLIGALILVDYRGVLVVMGWIYLPCVVILFAAESECRGEGKVVYVQSGAWPLFGCIVEEITHRSGLQWYGAHRVDPLVLQNLIA
jgi:hypothetical protein